LETKKEEKKMTRKERETELRMNIILESAERLFIANGYENTTMEQIANESEFSKGTLYNYFQSKDELYLAIGTKAYEIIIDYTKNFTEKEIPGVKQMMAIGYAYYNFTKDYTDFAHIFHDIAIKIPDVDKKPKNDLTPIEKEYLKKGNAYGEIFIKVITNAIKNNAIRSDKNPLMIGIVLSSMISGLMKELSQHREELEKRDLNLDEIIDFVFEMIGEGLKPR